MPGGHGASISDLNVPKHDWQTVSEGTSGNPGGRPKPLNTRRKPSNACRQRLEGKPGARVFAAMDLLDRAYGDLKTSGILSVLHARLQFVEQVRWI